MDIDEFLIKNDYLIKSNINKHFYNFANSDRAYDDLMQEGYIALWNAHNTYKDIGKDDFKYYASKCIYNKLASYVKYKKIYKDKHLSDMDKTDKEGNELTIEDTCGTIDDMSLFHNKSEIIKYTEEKKDVSEILQLLSDGYNQKEIAEKLGMKYRTLNRKVSIIKQDLSEILNIKIEKEKVDGKLIAIGDGFRKEFENIKECSRYVEADASSIRKICQKRPSRNTCYSKKLNMKLKFEWL